MTFNDYQAAAAKTAIYPKENSIAYLGLGLTGEAGEVADKIKKDLRDHGGEFGPDTVSDLILEMGDVLWYLSAMARELGFTLDQVAKFNLMKIEARQHRGTLHGSGGDR